MGYKVFDPIGLVTQGGGFVFGFFFSAWVISFLSGLVTGESIPFSSGKFLGIINLSSTIGIIMFLAMLFGIVSMWDKVAPIIKMVILGCMIPVILSLFSVDIIDVITGFIPQLERLTEIGNETVGI